MKNLRPETLGIVQRVEALSGCPIEFQPDSSLSIQATLQKARHGAAAHVLRYRPGSGPLDYWVAYQCAYALRFYALPPDMRFDFTDTGEGTEQVATLLTSGQSLPDADLERVPMFAHKVEQWALMTLLSYPVGMRVDQWLHDEYPTLRDVQRVGMLQIQQENLQLLSMAMGRLTVPVPLLGMPAAYALLADQLLGTSVLAIAYRAAGVMGVGEALRDAGAAVPQGPEHDRIRLKRAVKIDPDYLHAWVGIGVAYHRLKKPEQAFEAYREASRINPNDPYTLRNLGGLLIAMKRPAEGVPYLRKALALLPDDPQAIYGLALGLSDLDTVDADREADGLFNRIIQEHPTSPIVELAEKARTRLAHKGLQEGAVGGLRLDVVAYMTDALRTFDKVGPQNMQRIAIEIALLGQSGLQINDPAKQYTLKSLPGEFSGLQLLAIMYAAFQKIDPSADLGADFSGEYAVALKAVKGR